MTAATTAEIRPAVPPCAVNTDPVGAAERRQLREEGLPFFLLHPDIWERTPPGNDAFLLAIEFVYTFWGGYRAHFTIGVLTHTQKIASDIAYLDQKSFTSSKTL
jgi:hypothetical protein